MKPEDQARFDSLYQSYLNELTLQGKSEKTIDCYSRCIRQITQYFDLCPDMLTTEHLKTYFLYLVKEKSWSGVKISRNAIQFCYRHVLKRPWEWIDIVKPPNQQALQDVLSRIEVENIINATRKLSYQVYFLTTYSLGLRLSEALNLKISDVDSHLM
jgi:site-specific recombinase XerD